jgi:hypothetical protein
MVGPADGAKLDSRLVGLSGRSKGQPNAASARSRILPRRFAGGKQAAGSRPPRHPRPTLQGPISKIDILSRPQTVPRVKWGQWTDGQR